MNDEKKKSKFNVCFYRYFITDRHIYWDSEKYKTLCPTSFLPYNYILILYENVCGTNKLYIFLCSSIVTITKVLLPHNSLTMDPLTDWQMHDEVIPKLNLQKMSFISHTNILIVERFCNQYSVKLEMLSASGHFVCFIRLLYYILLIRKLE